MGHLNKLQMASSPGTGSHFYKIRVVLLLLLFMVAAQCAPAAFTNNSFFIDTYAEYEGLQPAAFQKEIERLQSVVQKMPDAPETFRKHIQLAFLYSHHRNPSPDYYRALEQLDLYILLDPQGSRQEDIRNWHSMLKEIVSSASSVEDCKGKAEQMKKDIVRIEKENAEIKEKLKQLKHLDIELEEKRRLVK